MVRVGPLPSRMLSKEISLLIVKKLEYRRTGLKTTTKKLVQAQVSRSFVTEYIVQM